MTEFLPGLPPCYQPVGVDVPSEDGVKIPRFGIMFQWFRSAFQTLEFSRNFFLDSWVLTGNKDTLKKNRQVL